MDQVVRICGRIPHEWIKSCVIQSPSAPCRGRGPQFDLRRRSSAWLEQRSFKPRVRGSSPRAGTKIEFRFGSRRYVTAAAYSQMYCQARMLSRRSGEAQGGHLAPLMSRLYLRVFANCQRSPPALRSCDRYNQSAPAEIPIQAAIDSQRKPRCPSGGAGRRAVNSLPANHETSKPFVAQFNGTGKDAAKSPRRRRRDLL